MSTTLAKQMIDRYESDGEFRTRLEAAGSFDDRRAILIEEGYGDVRLRHIHDAFPPADGVELSDEDLEAVAGGLSRGAEIGLNTGLLSVGSTIIGFACLA